MNYYKILGVDSTADQATIKNAFRKLAKKYHPDTNPGDVQAEKMFKDINEAYTILGNEEKRKEYDLSLNPDNMHGESTQTAKSKTTRQAANPFAGFTAQGFKMDFGDMMFDEINKNKQKEKSAKIDPADVSSQFYQFFGFSPKK